MKSKNGKKGLEFIVTGLITVGVLFMKVALLEALIAAYSRDYTILQDAEQIFFVGSMMMLIGYSLKQHLAGK